MVINLTLVVQAINFFVAYYILNTVLFKHAVAIIQREDTQRNALRQAIINEHRRMQSLQEQKQEQWKQYQRSLLDQQPQNILAEDILSIQSTPPIPQVKLSQSYLDTLTDDITTVIVQRITHD